MSKNIYYVLLCLVGMIFFSSLPISAEPNGKVKKESRLGFKSGVLIGGTIAGTTGIFIGGVGFAAFITLATLGISKSKMSVLFSSLDNGYIFYTNAINFFIKIRNVVYVCTLANKGGFPFFYIKKVLPNFPFPKLNQLRLCQ